MAHSGNSERGLRLLSFDGGGIRGLSSLLILERIMYRIKEKQKLNKLPLPCEYFDLIGGTSTGGLIAIMLGRLRMSVKDVIEAYRSLAQGVFSETKRFHQDGKFKASLLESAIKKIVSDNSPSGKSDELMKDPRVGEAVCRTFVCAHSPITRRGNLPILFRTYDSPHESARACKIWEAGRATSAAPTFFKRIEIGGEVFIDGGLGCNNPTDVLLQEAKIMFPNEENACVLSIGTGQLQETPIGKSMLQRVIPIDVINVMISISTECESTNQQMLRRFEDTPGVYFRFNVEQGLQGIKLGQWERLADVQAHTTNYISQQLVSQQLGLVVEVLKDGSTAELNAEITDIR